MPVRWDLTLSTPTAAGSGSVTAQGRALAWTGASTRIGDIASAFRNLDCGRLAILGAAGSGKTTLAIQLLLELLKTRADDEAVPLLVPVAGWDIEACPDLQSWLVRQISQDYPALSRSIGQPMLQTLARRGHVIPILDGFDELSEPARAPALLALRTLCDDDRLIVTCREEEYTKAVATADVLDSFARITARPLARCEVAGYLEQYLGPDPSSSWHKLIRLLRQSRARALPVIDVCSTPLGVWLLLNVYGQRSSDVSALLGGKRFKNADALRAHLLSALLPTLLRDRTARAGAAGIFRNRRAYDPRDAANWLGFLASLLTRAAAESGSTRDFRWWYLARTLPGATIRWTASIVTAVAAAAVTAVVLGLGGHEDLTLIVATGIGIIPATFLFTNWRSDLPGFARLGLRGRTLALVAHLAVGSISGFAIGLILFATSHIVPGCPRMHLTPAVAIGTLLKFAGHLVNWAEIPGNTNRAATPLANWRADRTLNLLRLTLAAICALLVTTLTWAIEPRLACVIAVVMAIFITTEGKHHAWLAYVIATSDYARAGQLPRQLMLFLDDMHRIGVLRAAGPAYQFRHAQFQDHLASRWEKSATKAPAGQHTL
jgi:hypothetical protein